MDRFVVRAPTWKTLEMSSFSSSFANVSLTGKRSTPKEDKSKTQSNRRLSIRDESLIKILTSQPDEPLIAAQAKDLSPFAVHYNGSFGGSNAMAVTREKYSQQSLRLASNDENTPPPNAQITLSEPAVGMMCSSGESNNSRPSTPVGSMMPANLASCTPKDNPFLARIQRDLNSPSAATRIRALKALRSPTKSSYANFDVPHEEQDIITEEERKSPAKVKSIQELMKDVVVYVEVRTGADNRSSGVKQVISALGAKVNDKLLRDTTHVVFKDGLLSTYNKAKKWNIPIVSILWIEACKKQMRLMPPSDYPISNADRYENPELYDKMKRYKSMQPDAEENRKQRAKAPTKENGIKAKTTPSTPSNSTKKKTDIRSLFSQPDAVKSTLCSESSTVSTSKKLPNKMTDNLCNSKTPSDSLMKLAYLDSVSNLSDTTELTEKSVGAKKTLNFDLIGKKPASNSSIKTPIRRRNSIQITQTPQKVNHDLAESEASNTPATSIASGVQARRRSSIHIPANMNVSEKCNDKSSKKQFATISEEVPEKPVRVAGRQQSTFAEKSMDITKNTPLSKNQSTRRRTLYTPRPMEETSAQTFRATASANRRRTIFATTPKASESVSMEMSSVAPITPFSGGIPSSTLVGEESVKTPVQFSSLLEEHASATIFSSTKAATNPRRRTLFDVSMDIISQRLQNINQSAKSSRIRPDDFGLHDRRGSKDDADTIAALLTPTGDGDKTIRKELFTGNFDSAKKSESSSVQTPSQTATGSSTTVNNVTTKKRKLFVPNDILLTPTPQSSTDSEDIAAASRKTINPDTISLSTQSVAKRRRTIMPTATTQPRSEQKKPATKINGTSRRSTMDFEAIKKAKSVINKKPVTSTAPSTKDAKINDNKSQPTQFLVYTNMHTEQIECIKEAISKLKGFQLQDKVSDYTTHLVSLEPRRTFNLLYGLVRGLWIVNYNWILDSVKAGTWLNEEEYELREFSRAVEICRSERQAFGKGYKMDLFSDVGSIYIASSCTVPKNNLKELITLCAGRLADRRKRAKYIIGDSNTEVLPGKFYLEPQWILDSISHKQIQKPTKYLCTFATDGK